MVVLTKLFGKKNKQTTPETAKTGRKPQPVAVTEKPSVQELVSQTGSEDRRQRQGALTDLAGRLDQKECSLDELASSGLTRTDQVALRLSQGAVTDDVTEAEWTDVALKGYSAAVRNAAAHQVTDESRLERLVKVSKGHDKAVYRIAKEKLEAIRDRQRALIEREEKALSVVESMERHARAKLDPLYAGKLKSLQEQWESRQDQASDELQQRFAQAYQIAEAKVSELEEAAEAEAEHHRAFAMADDTRQTIAERVLEELRERVDSLNLTEEGIREAQLFLTEQQHLWHESEQLSKPSKEEEKAFHRLSTAFEAVLAKQSAIKARFGDLEALLTRLEESPEQMNAEAHALDEWLHLLDWPQDTAEPDLKARVERALSRHHDQLAEHHKKEVQAVRQARGMMRRCMAAVNDGHLKRASGLLHGVQESLAGLREHQHPGLFRQYQEALEAVEQLRDWQSYAVQPKKEALIERMSHLLEQSMAPEARAQAIRSMQDEWRMLSRGLQNQHQELWEQFHELAQKAYEPCREFFNEQSKLRSLNLAKRRELIQQLEQYESITNWDNPDIKELDRVLNMARQDWRRLSPVDRAANKPVQKAFDEVYQRIRGRLQQEQSEFRDAKLAIIERAKALLEEEDVRQATETAKQLQKEWQQAGHLARRDEQALWKDFRAVCDQLFERRGQQIEAFKADLEEHRRQAEAVIARLEDLQTSADPLAEQANYKALRDEFQQLGTLPKAHHKTLMERFNQACKGFESASRAQKHKQKDNHWLALIEWVHRARFEAGEDEEALVRQFNELKVPAKATDLVNRVSDWRLPGEQSDELRRKTIELEALAGVETPEEDKGLRMELQVQRLAEGLGQQVTPQDFDQAVIDWLACGPVNLAEYEALAKRMKVARNAWLSKKT